MLLAGCASQGEVDEKPVHAEDDRGGLRLDSFGVVVGVVDGDTFRVNVSDGAVVVVRLLGVDFPDVTPARIGKWRDLGLSDVRIRYCYEEGNLRLQRMLLNQSVVLLADSKEQDVDRYGRLLRYVGIPRELPSDGGGGGGVSDDLSELLIRGGFAVPFDPTVPRCSNCGVYERVYGQVRGNSSGCLWGEGGPG